VTSNTDKILGGQMCLWENTEGTELAVDRQRVAAMAEKLWNPSLGLSFADFQARLAATDLLLGSVIAGDALALPPVVPEPAASHLLVLTGITLAVYRFSRKKRFVPLFFKNNGIGLDCR
jgi:hypothetical protein